MGKENIRGRIYSPHPPELPTWINEVQAGHPEAFDPIDNYLRPILSRYFNRRIQGQAQELTQTTLEQIFQYLPSFDPNLGKGEPMRNFHAWCFAIARGKFAAQLREQKRVITVSPDDFNRRFGQQDAEPAWQTDEKHAEEKLTERLKEWMKDNLKPRQQAIAELSFAGKRIPEIAAVMGVKHHLVTDILIVIRKKAEEQLLIPAGLIRGSSLPPTEASAARHGWIEGGVKILNLWYVTPQAVEKYRKGEHHVNSSLLDEGYLLLSRACTSAEYAYLRRHPDLKQKLCKEGNRIYIRQEDLDAFRASKHTLVRRRRVVSIPQAEDGYKRLTAFAGNVPEYQVLLGAAKRGELQTKKEGSTWFTTQEAIEQFRRDRERLHELLQNRETIIFSAEDNG